MAAYPEGHSSHALYPLFIDLRGCKVVVVGAGEVALRKTRTLVACGAYVHAVAPACCQGMEILSSDGAIELSMRAYQTEDLDGAMLVVAATDDPHVNTRVHDDAVARSMLVNVVDVPELCNAYVPSILQRGMLQIAVSTSGAAPSLARNVRQSLEDAFPAYWEDYVAMLAELRALVKRRIDAPSATRSVLFEQLTDGRLLAEFAQGTLPSADDVFGRYIEPIAPASAQDSWKEDAR